MIGCTLGWTTTRAGWDGDDVIALSNRGSETIDWLRTFRFGQEGFVGLGTVRD